MEKKQLIHIATNIYEEALWADSYWNVMNQYHINILRYNEEMNYSPAFYSIIYQALVEGLIMNLAKIYDSSDSSFRINNLISEMKYLAVDDFDISVRENYQMNDNHFHHTLEKDEELFFKNDVEIQERICKKLLVDYFPPSVYLTLDEIIELYTKKLYSISKIIDNLHIQRNKIYAHNDKKTNFDLEKICSEDPIKKDDVERLIKVALDISCFCIEILTGVYKAKSYINIDDWEESLKRIQIGSIYQKDL